jgi:hypothetical protein
MATARPGMSLSGSQTIFHRQRGAPVDCHVLHFGEPDHYLDQCLASLESEPVNVLIVRGGFPGNIGAARAYAVSLGVAPYWTFVDADDWLAPGIAGCCTMLMNARSDLVGVYTDYRGVSPDGALLGIAHKAAWTPLCLLTDCWQVLHYHQYRRDPMMQYLAGLATAPCYEETYIAGVLARHGDFMHIPEVGYYKRDGGQSVRLQDAALLRRIYREITPALLEANKRWIGTRRAA